MAFASHCGLSINAEILSGGLIAGLFCEELGVVLQCPRDHAEAIDACFKAHGFFAFPVATMREDDHIEISYQQQLVYRQARVPLQRLWSSTSFHMQSQRDNPSCEKSLYDTLLDEQDPSLSCQFDFDIKPNITILTHRPHVAILRERGVNGHREMAAAFDRAGLDCLDIHMNDLLQDPERLLTCQGLVVCGGFSYGDVLGAGNG
jgi:phosphoribosylformylglycinamidine synthase